MDGTITTDVASKLLSRFGDDEPEAAPAPTAAIGHHAGEFDIEGFIARHGLVVTSRSNDKSAAKYVLSQCPFNPDHRGKDAAIFRLSSGAIAFKCLHNSCADKKWRDVRLMFEPGAYDKKEHHAAATLPPPPSREKIHYRKITSAELANGNFELEYLIPGVLVAKQPCTIGGPQKSLKTSLLIDLAIGLDRGGYFLGYFKVARPATVAIMSGESGLATLQETAKRICRAAGCRLEDTGILWSDDLPKFGQVAHLEAIEEFIQGVEVLCIDPAYLAIPSGNEGSVFAQGELLRSVSDICQRNGTMLLLAHHLKKGRSDANAPPALEDLAWSGFAEHTRQWLLVGRREPYKVGSGDHKLWLSVGGSAGHNGLYGIDVTEGTQEDEGGRRWEVEVRGVRDTAAEAEKAKEKRDTEKKAQADARNEQKLRDALKRFEGGETSKVLRGAAGLNGDAFATAIRSLLKAERAEACQVTKGKREFDGYKPTKNT